MAHPDRVRKNYEEDCPDCYGTGVDAFNPFWLNPPCTMCKGTGKVVVLDSEKKNESTS